MFRVSIEDLQEFERVEEQLKGAITQYQYGILNLTRLAVKIKHIHSQLRTILERIGEIGSGIATRLEAALERISAGDSEFVTKSPLSYHQIVWETHRLLVNTLKQEGLKYYGPLFVGWKDKKSIPPELKFAAKLFGRRFHTEGGEVVVVKTETGWSMYVSAGGNPAHFTVVRRIDSQLRVSISDFLPARLSAVKEVLIESGFKQTGFNSIQRTLVLKNGTTSPYYNILLDIEGPLTLLDTLVKVLFMSTYLALGEVGSEKRGIFIIKHILRDYIRNPKPAVRVNFFAEYIIFSDLYDILSNCSDEEVVKILDELLGLPREKVWQVIRKKYHYDENRHEKKSPI